MKLNYKRTLFVGFAFFLICAFWQAYDGIVPLMLVNKFGMSQLWSGFIMALDNILALFMLPLFGTLSDKTNTKFGKRTPYIVLGTIVAIVSFVGLTFVDNAQLEKLNQGTNETYWTANYEIANAEYDEFGNKDVVTTMTVQDYASQMYFNKPYSQLNPSEQDELKNWYVGIGYDQTYAYDRESNTYKLSSWDSASEKFVLPENSGKAVNVYSSIVGEAKSQYASEITRGQSFVLVAFIVLLLVTLIAMATFRSPAVALMPDVTVKPLRSKANAIINLMGTAGGMIVLGIGIVFGTGKVQNQTMSYTAYVCAVCGLMLAALVAFIFLVREKKWSAEMQEEQARLDSENPETEKIDETTHKLSKEQFKSLLLILASVALWFIGYNAVTSKYSLYAVNVLNKDYNTTLLIAQGAAIVAYVPVGIIASKLGRKKTILIGVALLTLSFLGACFISQYSPTWLIYVLFGLAGIAWATINVNSFPMVVELSQGGDVGKYTGYYYTASMAAQIVTPILSGAIMTMMGNMKMLFPYATVFVGLSFVTMLFVKHGDSKPEMPKDKLEMLAGSDD